MTKNEMKARMQEEAREAYATMNSAAKALGYYYTVRGKMNDFCNRGWSGRRMPFKLIWHFRDMFQVEENK